MSLTMSIDRVSDIINAVGKIAGKQVLVGIPDTTDERQDGDPVGNAAIGYVMENGSPVHNIPARPFLVPGVASVQSQCADRLGRAAGAALDGKDGSSQLNAAGMIARDAAKEKINSNIAPALSPTTIAHRGAARGTGMRKSEIKYFELYDAGASPAEAQAAAGIVSLINTGQLRNSLTYVIRDKD